MGFGSRVLLVLLLIGGLQDKNQVKFGEKLADLQADFAKDRAKHGEWCYKKRLWNEAKAEAAEALKLDANHEDATALKDKAPDSEDPPAEGAKKQYEDKRDAIIARYLKKYEDLTYWAARKKLRKEAARTSRLAAEMYVDTQPASKILLKRLNDLRAFSGLEPVQVDSFLSYGALKHSQYLAKNQGVRASGGAHKEEPRRRGYTPQGERAARDSVISWGNGVDAVDHLIASLYHRLPLLSPELKWIGIGAAKGERIIVCIDSKGPRERGSWGKEPVIFPVDGQTEVWRRFVNEAPDPMPKNHPRPAGYPVTVQFPPGFGVTEATAELTVGGEKVDCFFSSPEKPASSFTQSNCICLIPKRPLRAAATYTAKFSCKVNGEPWSKEWSYTTRE